MINAVDMVEIMKLVNSNLDQALQAMDILEDILPLPSMPKRWFKDLPREKMMDIIAQGGVYQELCDILMTHPALNLIRIEGEASLAS